MKKLLVMVLIGAMLLLPTPALASTDARVNVEKVTFDKLETYIMDFNPQVRASKDQVADIIVPGNETRQMLTDSLNEMETQYRTYMGIAQNETDPDRKELYVTLAKTVEVNMISLKQQLDSFDKTRASLAESKYKATLQAEMGSKQMVRAAEQLYVNYHNIGYQIEQMRARESFLRKQLRVMELYRELGLIVDSSVKELVNGLKELENGLKALEDAQQTIIHQFNVMFNQNYDTILEIGELPEFDLTQIEEMDFEEDYEDAETKSYNVHLEDEDYYIEAAKKQFKLEFKNGYDKVFDKLESLKLEELKLEKLQQDYEFAKLKYELGLLSELKFSEQQLAYDEQKMKVQLAKNELFLAYRDYQWLKEGVSLGSASLGSGSMTGQGASSYSDSMALY